jgi:glycosyltransferase involved in cell wall biosynthesis
MIRGLRILTVIHLPWRRELGAVRGQLEMAEALRALGHTVDKYSLDDAFPRTDYSDQIEAGRLRTWLRMLRTERGFARRARRHIRRVASSYDVIEAGQGSLPLEKRQLGFRGLLVTRSFGLREPYDEFLRWARKRWPDEPRGTVAGRLLRWSAGRAASARAARSLAGADLINALNRDEVDHLERDPSLRPKAAWTPYGLSAERLASFAGAIAPATERLASPRVAFIGYWSTRKGARDWGRIVAGVRRAVPEARFDFLGTGQSEEVVRGYIEPSDAEFVRVVPAFESGELPSLLTRATVGAFPSYLEGFGFAVLEMLAAGLPTAAYDAPGPRETLPLVRTQLLTPLGKPDALAARLIELLGLEAAAYEELSLRCREVAGRFSWEPIAERQAALYRERLAALERPA